MLPEDDSRRSLKSIDVANLPIGPYDEKPVGDQGIPVELALLSILSNVVLPFNRTGLPIESTDHSITRTHDKQVTHDRGSGEDSASGVELPKKSGVRQTWLATLSGQKHGGQKQRGKQAQNSYSHVRTADTGN